MIDRLEELLGQVEEPEEGGEVLTLPHQPGMVKTSVPAETVEAEGGLFLSGSLPRGEETFPHDRGEGRERTDPFLFRRLASERETSGLAALYRQLSRESVLSGSSRPASVAVVQGISAPPAAGLTAGELDLAMRRDSRRYDGGMTIY